MAARIIPMNDKIVPAYTMLLSTSADHAAVKKIPAATIAVIIIRIQYFVLPILPPKDNRLKNI